MPREITTTILGLDVGGTKTAVLEGSTDGEIFQTRTVPTHARRPFDDVFPSLLEIVEDVRARALKAGRTPSCVSVSIGGPLRIAEGRLLDPPHLPGWHDVPLKERLEAAIPDLPAYVEHDGNAGALAEFHFGVGKDRHDLRHLAFLTFGTGMGAGFILNGEVLYGATDTAGEIGHWRLAEDGPVGFGKAGSFEGFAAGRGLVQLAALRFPERWRTDTQIRALVDDMLAGDEQALQVAHEAGRWIGRGLALLIDALNPQVIVLGSLAMVLGERVLGPAREVVAAEALPQAAAACEIIPSELGSNLGNVAALMAGIRRMPQTTGAQT